MILLSIAVSVGILTSILLESSFLSLGKDKLPLSVAVKTAVGMRLVSMTVMEASSNFLDYHLTGGVVHLDSLTSWLAAALSTFAGFVAPLPYNYTQLKLFGKACH